MDSEHDGFEVFEADMPGGKVDFNTCVMIGMITCNKLLAHINDVPPGLHTMAMELKDDDLHPNRLNYISAVDAIEITLAHIIQDDKYFKEEFEKLEKQEWNNTVDYAKAKHRILVRLMARNGLLPLQVM